MFQQLARQAYALYFVLTSLDEIISRLQREMPGKDHEHLRPFLVCAEKLNPDLNEDVPFARIYKEAKRIINMEDIQPQFLHEPLLNSIFLYRHHENWFFKHKEPKRLLELQRLVMPTMESATLTLGPNHFPMMQVKENDELRKYLKKSDDSNTLKSFSYIIDACEKFIKQKPITIFSIGTENSLPVAHLTQCKTTCPDEYLLEYELQLGKFHLNIEILQIRDGKIVLNKKLLKFISGLTKVFGATNFIFHDSISLEQAPMLLLAMQLYANFEDIFANGELFTITARLKALIQNIQFQHAPYALTQIIYIKQAMILACAMFSLSLEETIKTEVERWYHNRDLLLEISKQRGQSTSQWHVETFNSEDYRPEASFLQSAYAMGSPLKAVKKAIFQHHQDTDDKVIFVLERFSRHLYHYLFTNENSLDKSTFEKRPPLLSKYFEYAPNLPTTASVENGVGL